MSFPLTEIRIDDLARITGGGLVEAGGRIAGTMGRYSTNGAAIGGVGGTVAGAVAGAVSSGPVGALAGAWAGGKSGIVAGTIAGGAIGLGVGLYRELER